MKTCMASVRKDEFEVNEGRFMDTPDINVAICLGADRHFWLGERDLDRFAPYDRIVMTMSKIKQHNYEKKWMELVYLLRERYGDSKCILMYQEAELEWPIYRPFEDQCELYQAIKKCDAFLSHNETCKEFYRRIRRDDRVIVANTPMPIERMKKFAIDPKVKAEKKKRILFGATMDHRAYGFLGYIVAGGLLDEYPERRDEFELVQFSRIGGESDPRAAKAFETIGYPIAQSYEYMSWTRWLEEMAKNWAGFGLMQAAAAGRDVIAMAALGVPYVCNNRLDAARICFPWSSVVDTFDLNEACSELRGMMNDDFAYNKIRNEAMHSVTYFSKENITLHINRQLKELGL